MRLRQCSTVNRRTALAGMGAAGIGFVGLGRSLTLAQDATPGAATGPIPTIIQQWAAATEAEDVDALVALYTDDVFFESVPIGEVANGIEEFRASNQAQFDAYTDITVEVTGAFASDTWAMAEGVYSGIYSGQIVGLPPGTGQVVTTRFVSVFELQDGLFSRESDYYDLYLMLTQLGVFDTPTGDATPAS